MAGKNTQSTLVTSRPGPKRTRNCFLIRNPDSGDSVLRELREQTIDPHLEGETYSRKAFAEKAVEYGCEKMSEGTYKNIELNAAAIELRVAKAFAKILGVQLRAIVHYKAANGDNVNSTGVRQPAVHSLIEYINRAPIYAEVLNSIKHWKANIRDVCSIELQGNFRAASTQQVSHLCHCICQHMLPLQYFGNFSDQYMTHAEVFVLLAAIELSDLDSYLICPKVLGHLNINDESRTNDHSFIANAIRQEADKDQPFGHSGIDREQITILIDFVASLVEFNDNDACPTKVNERFRKTEFQATSCEDVRHEILKFFVGVIQAASHAARTRDLIEDASDVKNLFEKIYRCQGPTRLVDTNLCLNYLELCFSTETSIWVDDEADALVFELSGSYPHEMIQGDDGDLMQYIQDIRRSRLDPIQSSCIKFIPDYGKFSGIRIQFRQKSEQASIDIPTHVIRHVIMQHRRDDFVCTPHTPLSIIQEDFVGHIDAEFVWIKLANKNLHGLYQKGILCRNDVIEDFDLAHASTTVIETVFNPNEWKNARPTDPHVIPITNCLDCYVNLTQPDQETCRTSVKFRTGCYSKIVEQFNAKSSVFVLVNSTEYKDIVACLGVYFKEARKEEELYAIGNRYKKVVEQKDLGNSLARAIETQYLRAQNLLSKITNAFHHSTSSTTGEISFGRLSLDLLRAMGEEKYADPVNVVGYLQSICPMEFDQWVSAHQRLNLSESNLELDDPKIEGLEVIVCSQFSFHEMVKLIIDRILPRFLFGRKHSNATRVRLVYRTGVPLARIEFNTSFPSSKEMDINDCVARVYELNKFLVERQPEFFAEVSDEDFDKYFFVLPLLIFASLSCGQVYARINQDRTGAGITLDLPLGDLLNR